MSQARHGHREGQALDAARHLRSAQNLENLPHEVTKDVDRVDDRLLQVLLQIFPTKHWQTLFPLRSTIQHHPPKLPAK